MQLHHLKAICAAHAHTIVAEYVDVASGRTVKGRDRYIAMMEAARKHSFDAVVAFKLDRFHRNVREQLSKRAGWPKRIIGFSRLVGERA